MTHRPLGGTGLLMLMSFATIFPVAAIAAFCVAATWTLLPVIMFVLLLMAGGVAAALGRLLDE